MKVKQLLSLLILMTTMGLLAACGGGNDTPDTRDYIRHVTPTGEHANRIRAITYVTFDDLTPEGYRLTQSWDAMGMCTNETVYVGFTAFRPDGLEDFLLFSYNHTSGRRRFIGSFMQAAQAAGNLEYGEEMPKGHTRLVYANGMLYMTSQGFHDFKESLDRLEEYRGAHLFRYDIANGEFTNVTAHLPDGVIIPHEGIIALKYMPSAGYLVGLTHPHSNLVFIDMETYEVSRVAQGIPWSPGLVVSRDLVVDDINQRVFIYRGPENVYRIPGSIYTSFTAMNAFPVYMYDLATDALSVIMSPVEGGMWGTTLVRSDGQKAYVSTVGGFLVEIDFATPRARIIGNLLPREFVRAGHRLNSLYHITFSPDETRLYTIPTYAGYITGLYEFDLYTRESVRLVELPARVYTGNGIIDSGGNLYFAAFGYHNWSGDCRLMIIEIEH